MIKNNSQVFLSLVFAGLSAVMGSAYAEELEPAASLIPQVLSVDGAIPSIEYGKMQYAIVKYGASGNPVVFSVLTTGSTPFCRIEPLAINAVKVYGLAVGKCTLLANQDGNAVYAKAAELKFDMNVVPAAQVISLNKPLEPLKVGVAQTVGMSAGASGNPVVFGTLNCSVSADAANKVATITPTAVGSCNIGANQAGNTNYAKGVLKYDIYANVSIGDSTLEFTTPTSIAYKQPLTLTFNRSGSTSPITIGSTTASVCTVAALANGSKALVSHKPGLCSLRAEMLTDKNYVGAVAYADITITKAVPTPIKVAGITSLNVYKTGDLTVQGGGSSMPLILSSETPSQCVISGLRVTADKGGVCTLKAMQAGDDFYLDAPTVYYSFPIVKAAQTIELNPIPVVKVRQEQTLSLKPENVGLPVFFAVDATSTACSMFGANVIGLAAGNCTIKVTRPGDDYRLDAPFLNIVIDVQKGPQDITISTVDTLGRGGYAPISASSNQPITPATPILFSLAPSSICVQEGNQIRGVGLGVCTISATQLGDANYLQSTVSKTVEIVKGSPTLKFTQLPELRVNAPIGKLLVSTTYTGTPLSVSTSPSSVCAFDSSTNELAGLAAGDCLVKVNQAGDAEYNAASEISTTLRVLMGAQVIQFPSLGPIALNATGTTLVASTSAKPDANLQVTFESATPTVCSVSGVSLTPLKMGTCTVRAIQAGNENYLPAATVTQDIAITTPIASTILSSSANPAKVRNTLTLTASVSGNAPTGTVGFLENGIAIGNCAAVPVVAGKATCSTAQLKVGSHQIVASYSGDANNQGSQSLPLSQEVFSLDWLPSVLNLLLN